MKKIFIIIIALLATFRSYADEPLKIAYLTDNHVGSAGNNADFEACVADINTLDSISFVLVGGDITHMGSDIQIHTAKKILDKLNVPYWVVSGNHDSKWSESGCNTFIRTFGYEQFDFEAGGYRFLGCNSGPDMRFADALIPRNSLEWIKNLEPGKPVIFLNHYPLSYGLANWFEIRRELIRLDCRWAIAGHGHSNVSFDYYGLPGMMGRTSMKKKGIPGYNIITIKDGVAKAVERLIKPEGAINCDEPWYTRELTPVTDTLRYDSDGLPVGYKYFGFKDNSKYPQVKVLWKKTEDANIGSGFATDKINAWYATASGKVVCMTVKDGKTIWEVPLPGKIYGTPALKDNIIVVPCTDGGIYAFEAATGKQIWEHKTDKGIVASPTIFGTTVYVGSSEGKFRALRLKDGKLLWVFEDVKGFCDGAPHADKSQVIFNTWGNKTYSLDPRNGTLQWVWSKIGSSLVSGGSCTPLKSGNRVFIVSADRRTYCLDTWTGNVLYFADCGRESFALSEDGKTIYVKEMFGTAYAIPTQTPLSEINGTLAPDSPSRDRWMPDVPVYEPEKVVWKVESGLGSDAGSSALCVCGDLLIIPSAKGDLHCLDRNTGAKLWVHKVGVGIANPVSAWMENDKILILTSTMDGKIELLEIEK